ncbi:MAG TPA: hypothetical protein VKR06_23840 [Ktedonosporobacter sp.]|nr:hypothetical protein [Ktedonosporobacter sp.]
MNKDEVKRLKSAIERMRVVWLHVYEIVLNETSNTYELACSYREQSREEGGTTEIWKRRRISTPREWTDLLTKHLNAAWDSKRPSSRRDPPPAGTGPL